jgi:hypothetical protein
MDLERVDFWPVMTKERGEERSKNDSASRRLKCAGE